MTALLALGAVLRLVFLGSRSLWFDEASTLILARLPLAGLPALLVRNETNPPLYYALMHVWLKLFADPRLGLRLFSAFCGIAAVAAFRPLVERLLPARARLLALFFAAFSSYWIHLAQDGRVYSVLLLVSILWLRVVWDLSEAPTPRRWLAYALLSALGLHLHYYFAFPLASEAAWLAWRFRRSSRDLGAWAAAHFAATALFAPWLPSLAAQVHAHVGDRTVGDPLTPAHLLDSFGTMFFDVTFLGLALPHWLNAAIGAVFAAFVAASFGDASERGKRDFLLFSLLGPVVLIAVAELVVRRPITQARYFVPLSPLAFLLAARSLAGPGRWTAPARLTLAAVVAAGVAGYFVSGWLIDPRLEALAGAIRRGSPAGAPVVYVDMYDYLPMRAYYLPERRNLLIASAGEGMDFSAIPPYDGVLEESKARAVGPCVVVDVKRRLSGQTVWTGTGAQLAGLLEGAK